MERRVRMLYAQMPRRAMCGALLTPGFSVDVRLDNMSAIGPLDSCWCRREEGAFRRNEPARKRRRHITSVANSLPATDETGVSNVPIYSSNWTNDSKSTREIRSRRRDAVFVQEDLPTSTATTSTWRTSWTALRGRTSGASRTTRTLRGAVAPRRFLGVPVRR